jgi:MerR family transcriptional activator of bmr gene
LPEISEFASLRNININSLRYYEKLGILVPAYIDPVSGYRYYAAEQLLILDNILLFINLGLPLKDLKEKYMAPNGELNTQHALEDGRLEIEEKIAQMRNTLDIIDYSLSRIQQNKASSGNKGLYNRFIKERRVICTPFFPLDSNYRKVMGDIRELY